MKRTTIGCGLIALAVSAAGARAQGDPAVTERLIEEGTKNSHVWEYLVYLSEEIGPRLTGSTASTRANAWTRDAFASFGLSNAHLAKWGEIPVRFDRGASRARMIEPVERDFEFTARAWSAGTEGPLRGKVIKAPKSIEELEAIGDELAGAWVLDKQPRRRRRRPRDGGDDANADEARQLREELARLLREADIAGRLYGASDDLVRTGGQRGWREMAYDDLPDEVSVSVRRSDYDAMNSRLADGEAVEAEIDLQHHFVEGPFPVFNTIAEIRGEERPGEVVIVSGHLDTWDGPGTQGAQDNGTGCAVVLEAARILTAAEVKPKRTIRFILWTGEEQGLLGSRAYVEGLSDEEKAGISAVFVEDGGTNYEGGLLCIDTMAPMLEQATAAVNATFPDMPVELLVRERMPRGGGSDHMAFNRAGIPGFFWQERGRGGREGKDYRFIHHTQNDTVRYAVPEYLVQSATCSAITAYNLAMADTLLPRQEMEEEAPAEPEPSPDPTFIIATGPLTGDWKGVYTGDDAPSDSGFTLTFEMSEDGRARGLVDSQWGQRRFTKIVYDAEARKVTCTRESESMGRIVFEATIEGEEMKGTVNFDDQFTMPFRATRARSDITDTTALADDKAEAEAATGSPK